MTHSDYGFLVATDIGRIGFMEDRLVELEQKVAFLERHVEEQDTEMLRLSRLFNQLSVKLERAEERIRDLTNNEPSDGDRLNLHEKPPHY
ncbi:MAG: SlyX family protein [Opitutales bacterium]|nr:SlyX family protein [Opitutales bacterium]NRA27592.1 SlyX family protein [Opitutales bacterium]